MPNSKLSAIYEERKLRLNQIIVEILKAKPDGILSKEDLWNAVSQKEKSLKSCRSFGVRSITSLLRSFDNIEEVEIENVKFIKLKSDSLPREVLESRLNHLKEVVFKVLQSNGGQVKRSMLWNLVAQEQGRSVVASDFQVSNIYEILNHMSDFLQEVQIRNERYVRLIKMPTHHRFDSEGESPSYSNAYPSLLESMTSNPQIPSPRELSEDLMKLLSDFPDGVLIDKIWNVYKQKTGKKCPSPENYNIRNMNDIFKFPEFQNLNQAKRNGKTWLCLKSWDASNQPRSAANIAGGSKDLVGIPLASGWGAPAPLAPRPLIGPMAAAAPFNMNLMAYQPVTQEQKTSKDVSDSLYISQEPRLPSANSEKTVVVNPINLPKGKCPSKEQLDSFAKECIEIISDAHNYVSGESIEKLLLQRLGRKKLNDVGLRDIEQLSSVREHIRLLCKVNAYIQAFVKVRSICTLQELEESISDYVTNGDNFESLKLGPLHRLPMVFDMFKYPVDKEEFPDIHTMDIMQKIRDFLTEKQKWTEKLQMEEIMAYLTDAYNVDTPFNLGIRIRSLPLVVGVLKRAQSDAARKRRSVYNDFQKELEKELRDAFSNFRHHMISTKTNTKSLNEHYLKLSAEMVIQEIFGKLVVLMNIEEPSNRTERKQKNKRLVCFETFVQMLKEDKLARLLFHVAICVSNTDLQEAAMDILAPSSPPPASTGAPAEAEKQAPTKDELLQKLQKYLIDRMNVSSLSLVHLDKIEAKLLEDFQFHTFSQMGYGRFLKFLLNDPNIKKILDESGVTLGMSSGNVGDSFYQPQLSDVLSFVQQCVDSGIKEPNLIEGALCHQYSVKEVKKLGFGTTQRLITNSERKMKPQGTTNVLFESALCAAHRSFAQSQGKVGILGHQTKEAALAILHNCPFLEDLSLWSHWPAVFEPQFGKLKDFLNRHGGEKSISLEGGTKSVHVDILAIETEPGKYLKLVSHTSVEQFMNACLAGDVVRTCGHLVSIIGHNKGLENAPLALLANHMKIALFTIQGNDISDFPFAENPAKFVLACLVKLPLQISISLANQIFLDPLAQVIGQTKSKKEILNCCTSLSESSRLEELGFHLGITDWSECFIKYKSAFLEEQIETIAELESEDELVEDNDIEEESSEDEESGSSSDEEEKEILDTSEQPITTAAETTAAVVASTSEEMECDQIIDDEKSEEKGTKDGNGELVAEAEAPDAEMAVETAQEEEKEGEEKEEESNVHKDLINVICREEFGIGVELNEDGQKLMRRQQERLGRSLDRLSKDLYSKDSHFVLELVQNADDNSYPEEFNHPDSKQHPSVKFTIDNSTVTVLNNECGFREKDIRALCDVGKSTKGKHKFGYIGQKGIGFKSVFRVTDTPEIHSNNYHIYFDVNSGPMGYIQPHWIEDHKEIEENWVTKIVLPLKETIKTSKSLAASFNDIHPSLLLFLHRLKEITIDNKVENSQTKMCRYDLDFNVIEIHFDSDIKQWLVLKKLLDASNISSQVKSGVEVESSEIALAFPLKSCNMANLQVLPPKQPVFAFLPLRSYGFRFIIQGDFDLPSSREDVDKDSPWNQWLKNEIPTLFLESLEEFKAHPSFKSVVHAVAAYLQFVPGEDEVLDFFRPVAAHILKKLRSKACIPTQPFTKDGTILWKLPSQTVSVTDSLIRDVATPEMLQKLLNLYYIHHDMAGLLNSSLAHSLGIEKLTTDHLLKIGIAIGDTWMDVTSVNSEHLLMISKWLACIYRSLDDLESNDEILSKISHINLFPLNNGKLIALKDKSVFLPVNENRASTQPKAKDCYDELWNDLNSIHPDLFSTDDAEINSQVKKLILQLGVKELFPNNILYHHILPAFQGEQWKTKSEKLLVDYVSYIKEQSEKSSLVNFNEFLPVIQIKTNQGMKNPQQSSIHFTPSYGNNIDLKNQLSGYNWVLVDDCYIKGLNKRPLIQSWHEFFSRFGLTDFLAVNEVSVPVDPENYAQCPWGPFYPHWPSTDDSLYEVKDYSCSEFENLVKHNSHKETYNQQMQILFKLLDQKWDSHYAKYAMTNVFSAGGEHSLHETPTSFAIHLKQLPWLPACQTILNASSGNVDKETITSCEKPSSIYLNSNKLKSLLGHSVFYLDAPLSNSSSFSSFLQIKSVVNADVIVELLLKWSARADEAGQAPTEFCTSLSHIKTVYRYLSDELNNKTLQDLFHTKPVIFVPNCDHIPPNKIHLNVVGKMHKREEIWWEDSTGLFQKYHSNLVTYQMSSSGKREIGHLYKDMNEFFELAVRVLRYPQLYEYGELIQVLAYSLPEEGLTDVLTLFNLIGEKMFLSSMSRDLTLISVFEQEKKKLLNQISNEAIFPTKQGRWVGKAEHPIIADDKELEKLFEDKPINFVKLSVETKDSKKTSHRKIQENPEKEKFILEFLKFCNVSKLSESFTYESITEHFIPFPELQDYMHKIVPNIQRYFIAYFPDIYQKWRESKFHQEISDWTYAKCKKLEGIYSLKQKQDITVVTQEKCLIENKTFLVQEKAASSYQDIDRYIARYFSLGDKDCCRQLKLFLNELRFMNDQNLKDIENELLNQEILPLSSDEPVWLVPKPVLILPSKPIESPIETSDPKVSSGIEKSNKTSSVAAWPPCASSASSVAPKSNTSTKEKLTTMWPLPQSPAYMDQIRDSSTKFTIGPSIPAASDSTSPKEKSSESDAFQSSSSSKKRENPSSLERRDSSHKRPLQDSLEKRPENKDGNRENTGLKTGEDFRGPSSDSDPSVACNPDKGVTCPSQGSQERSSSENKGSKSIQNPLDPDVVMQDESRSPEQESHQTTNRKRSSEGGMEPGAKRHPEPSFGLPHWLQTAQDLEYKELTITSELKIPDSIMNQESNDYNLSTGRWGENLVFNYLLQQKIRSDSYIFSVVWVNEVKESGKPYDFEIKLYKTDSTSSSSLYTVYIEVKSTLSDKKEAFEVSGPEIEFALKQQSNFHIYRVYNAGNTEKVRLVKIENLASQIEQNNIRLCLVL